MNTRHLLLALSAIILLLPSCGKDSDHSPEIIEPEGTAMVRIKINNAGYGTKSLFPDNEIHNTEKNIYNYAVLVFNSNRILEHTEFKTFSGENGGTPNSGDFVTDQFEVTLGMKYFFVVANVPVSKLMQDQDNFSPDQDVLTTGIQEYIFELETIDQIMRYLESGSQVNLNNKNRGFMMTTLDGLVAHNINIEKDEANPNSINNITLNLGRAMAKVSLANGLTQEVQANLWGTLENIEYKVGNNPKKMYVVPHFLQSDIIATPNYYDTSVNPNDYFGPLDDYQPSSATGNNTYTYCTENANQKPKMGNATVAYIKGKFVPNDANIQKADGSSATQADLTGGTFWRIKDTALNTYINNIYYADDPTSLLNPGEEAVKYEDGICYYTLYLENPNKSDNDKYTVKRNSLYKITLSKVSDAGEPDENDLIPDKEIPLDGSGLVEASIELVDWDKIDWNDAEV